MNASLSIKDNIGNIELLNGSKIAFLCSRKVPAAAVLRCYDWAIEQREAGNCVISGFHSQLEKDVLRYLLRGQQPIIVVLARGLKARLEPVFEKPLAEGRLLIITPFDQSVKRVTEDTAMVRNQMMMALCDSVTVGYEHPDGKLEGLFSKTAKPIQRLV